MSDAELLDFIVASTRERGYPPSVRECADRFDRAVSSIHFRLARLHREGRVTSVASSPRTLVVVR